MPVKSINILSTRPVHAALITTAAQKSIIVDAISFIETTPIASATLQQQIQAVAMQPALVIFTSMNAVEAVAAQLSEVPQTWRIACMGHTSKTLVLQHFNRSELIATANDATALAQEVCKYAQQYAFTSIVFFCGDQRRDELPQILRSAGLALEELVVYETIAKHHTIEKQYDAVLFFSPSAAHSFFQTNTLDKNTIVFAIGNTTANAVKNHTGNKIITANEPSKNCLLQQAIDYFSLVHN